MPRSEEAEWWTNAVYAAVQEIPPRQVTTYGYIAFLLGEPQRGRQVGMSLKALPAPESGLHFTSQSVPWQRVINAKGMISHREPGGATRQADALRLEGVEVTTDNMGEMHVSFPQYGWFPKRLPSEEADDWL